MSCTMGGRDDVTGQADGEPGPTSVSSLDETAASSHQGNVSPEQRCLILDLPAELISTILSHLSAQHLAFVSATCRSLREHANADLHWQRIIQQHVPGATVSTPGPLPTFRELYACHDLLWFLPQHKVWFCDHDRTGKVMIARYDPRRGCIEGYRLLATNDTTAHAHWNADPSVIIHEFQSRAALHLDRPMLKFRAMGKGSERDDGGGYTALENAANRPGANRFADERPMALEERWAGMHSNFLLAKTLDPGEASVRIAKDFPYDYVWPPPAIPSRDRVSGAQPSRTGSELSQSDRPYQRSNVSDRAFRVRRWAELGRPRAHVPHVFPWEMGGGFPGVVQMLADIQVTGVQAHQEAGAGGNLPAFHFGDEMTTYSTLDPALYTPTGLKPWRGIWVGDYGPHGCEFLLIHQPDDDENDNDREIARGTDESDQEWEKRAMDARVHRGKMEAIKLTGDLNVPRGERSFIVEDLALSNPSDSPDLEPFVGCRFVRSKGHIANTGFLGDEYIDCQLIIINHNRLAQYWMDFNHISYFERVDIDQFLKP